MNRLEHSTEARAAVEAAAAKLAAAAVHLDHAFNMDHDARAHRLQEELRAKAAGLHVALVELEHLAARLPR
jgi:hypothetical protein